MIIIISQNTKRREGIYTLKTDSTHKDRVFYNCVRHISRQRKEKGRTTAMIYDFTFFNRRSSFSSSPWPYTISYDHFFFLSVLFR